ncbi:MAG: sigma 54-interacting transcriptional regulator [Thermodesulfovibrionales bacterium]
MDFSLLEGLADGVIVIDKNKKILYANEKAKSFLSRKIIPGDPCNSLTPICRGCPMRHVEDTKEAIEIYDAQLQDRRLVYFSMAPVFQDCKFVGVIELFRNIDEIIPCAEEIASHKELMGVILNSLVEAVLALDKDGNVIEYNAIAKKILCWKEVEELKGRNIKELLNLSLEDLVPDGERADVWVETPCGKEKASLLISPLTEGGGYVVSFYIIRSDSYTTLKEGFITETKYPNFQKILDLVTSIADVNVNILIEGETGTGKSLLARYIHSLSSSRDKPFVTINCSAIPDNLLEAELFGYTKGAFTGAVCNKPGKVEIADGGTLFLDEIGDMPLHLQGKILHLIQHKEFERLGEIKPRKVNIRIIAATNKDLKVLIKKGLFRKDLFYRLNIINIPLPPLRERREDIPPLVNHFIEKFNKIHNRKIKSISSEVMKRLLSYDYPGNIRELENIIERAVITCKGNIIKTINIEERTTKEIESERVDSDIAKEQITKALKEAGYNKSLAAKMLGVHRTTLWRKLKTLNYSN